MTYEPSNRLSDRIERKIRPLRNRRMIRFKLDRPVISITFDDFPKSAVSVGAKMLDKYGWTGTFYTCAAYAGTTNHHGPQYDAADLPALESSGHEIAGHTFDHVDCTQLNETELMDQLKRNRGALAQMGVKQSITGFAYPYGATKAGLKAHLGQCYHAVRGIESGVQYNCADLNELKSEGLYSDSVKSILSTLSGLSRRPGWYTLFTHDICDNPTQWGCTPHEFEAALKTIKSLGAVVLPIRDAVTYLENPHV